MLMNNKTYEVPVRVDIDLKTSESETTYKTLTANGYKNYERIWEQFARDIYDQLMKDILSEQEQ